MVASSSGHPKPPPSIGQCTFRVVGPLLRLYWMYFRPIRQLKLQSSDCSGIVQCIGASSMPPVSLVEFTLNSAKDFYDVSLKDGYNLPISIIHSGGTGNCYAVNCASDSNRACPPELAVAGGNRATVVRKSTCVAFN